MNILRQLHTQLTYMANAVCWPVFGNTQSIGGSNERDLPITYASLENTM